MNQKILFSILCFITLFSCGSIKEAPLLYDDSYMVGFNYLLRFDGYYIDSRLMSTYVPEEDEDTSGTYLNTPLFFYDSGTVKIWPGIESEIVANQQLVKNKNKNWGRVGVYTVTKEYLYIEYWQNAYASMRSNRKTIALKISPNQLQIIGKLNKDKEIVPYPKEYQQTLTFVSNDNKPDPPRNWIAERDDWNN